MRMDSRDNNVNEWSRLWNSFSYAINGLKNAIIKERNLQIHLVIAVVVIIVGICFKLSLLDWAILTIVIGGMIVLELINTAIERLVDLVTMEYHPLAKIVKDISAAAVFVFAIIAVIVGILIFYPYVEKWF
ncbi:diacylglycerol kinase family protein [Bacillus sp. PS06]|uniref:diacylglycerol kinase family protein n=1 Tax=Bacillus sp. PS06 TaxID=2764176 RepID=UPI00178479F0|nr:diacylglycerol kinase family protein [Bacillus sp. PS06]MBD8069189.1 diacylglycerol kinase family protein [Bacillus sp. PS06]